MKFATKNMSRNVKRNLNPKIKKKRQALAEGGEVEEDEGTAIKNKIYSKYPGLKALGDVTLKADTSFTRENTGIGDIEYFSPKDTSYTYGNGFIAKNPKVGTHGILYNPKTNDETSIMLDMLHGMKDVNPQYAKYRTDLANSLFSNFHDDIENEWKLDGGKSGNTRKQFENSWIDGVVRNLMIENPEDFKKYNYWDKAKETYLADPKAKEAFDNLRNEIMGIKPQGKANGGLIIQDKIMKVGDALYNGDIFDGLERDQRVHDQERNKFFNSYGARDANEFYKKFPSKESFDLHNMKQKSTVYGTERLIGKDEQFLHTGGAVGHTHDPMVTMLQKPVGTTYGIGADGKFGQNIDPMIKVREESAKKTAMEREKEIAYSKRYIPYKPSDKVSNAKTFLYGAGVLLPNPVTPVVAATAELATGARYLMDYAVNRDPKQLANASIDLGFGTFGMTPGVNNAISFAKTGTVAAKAGAGLLKSIAPSVEKAVPGLLTRGEQMAMKYGFKKADRALLNNSAVADSKASGQAISNPMKPIQFANVMNQSQTESTRTERPLLSIRPNGYKGGGKIKSKC